MFTAWLPNLTTLRGVRVCALPKRTANRLGASIRARNLVITPRYNMASDLPTMPAGVPCPLCSGRNIATQRAWKRHVVTGQHMNHVMLRGRLQLTMPAHMRWLRDLAEQNARPAVRVRVSDPAPVLAPVSAPDTWRPVSFHPLPPSPPPTDFTPPSSPRRAPGVVLSDSPALASSSNTVDLSTEVEWRILGDGVPTGAPEPERCPTCNGATSVLGCEVKALFLAWYMGDRSPDSLLNALRTRWPCVPSARQLRAFLHKPRLPASRVLVSDDFGERVAVRDLGAAVQLLLGRPASKNLHIYPRYREDRRVTVPAESRSWREANSLTPPTAYLPITPGHGKLFFCGQYIKNRAHEVFRLTSFWEYVPQRSLPQLWCTANQCRVIQCKEGCMLACLVAYSSGLCRWLGS